MIHFIVVIIKQKVMKMNFNQIYKNVVVRLDPLLTKQKRQKTTGAKCKKVQILYNKIVSLFQGIADLIQLGKFTDTIILAVSFKITFLWFNRSEWNTFLYEKNKRS